MTGDVLNAEARRHLPLGGTYNVRDIGGYATTDGRTTRWRTLIRSDSLHRLAPEAPHTLLDLGLRTMIDLRRPAETVQYPNLLAT
ncbi:MAG TPA: tyrosine-protein phosphatase, partial [Thermomicrobiales bacterium]